MAELTKEFLVSCMNEMRDNYQCERIPWVMPADIYDAAQRQVEDGTASETVKRIFAASVRAEAPGEQQ